MPRIKLNDAIKEAYSIAPSDIVIFNTIEIDFRNLIDPIRVVNNNENIIAKLENNAPKNPGEKVEFLAYPFLFDTPKISINSNVYSKLVIDNTDNTIIKELEEAQKPYNESSEILVRYRPYLSNDLNKPQYLPIITLVLTDIVVTTFNITGKCSFGDFSNIKFPNKKYTAINFPGLVV